MFYNIYYLYNIEEYIMRYSQKNKKFELIGLLAALISLIAFYELVFFNFNLSDTTSLSWIWLITGITTQIMWGIYGFSNYILPTMIAAPLFFIGYSLLLFLKIKLETEFI